MPALILTHGLPPALARILAKLEGYSYATDFTPGATPRLVLLGPDGEAGTLAAWRGQGLKAPALRLGLPGTEDAGVAESLPLPVRLGLLRERMAYYVNIAAGQDVQPVICGPYRLDPQTRDLTGPGGAQSLTDKEAAIFALLARALPAMRRRDELLREIWGYTTELDTHTLETHIYRLRRKLAELGGGVDLTTMEDGYCLNIA